MTRNALLVLILGLLLAACSEEKSPAGDAQSVDTTPMACNLSTLTPCASGCADLTSDPNNCGMCGTQCNAALGEACSFGVCSTCPAGVLDCGSGCNVDGLSDELNCGKCGVQCGPGQSCQQGACVCDGGTELCQTSVGLACVPVLSDPMNCGQCGTSCGAQVCSGGVCSATCAGTETNCNGFCADTQTDEAHCGGCNMPCGQGQECNGGFCGCPVGERECGGQCVNTNSSALHCGACDNACPAGGTCAVVGGVAQCQCPAGQMDCGGICQAQCDPNAVPTPGMPTPDGAGGAGNMPAEPAPDGAGGMTMAPPTETVAGRDCPAYEGLIADFEEGSAAVLELEGRVGLFEGYNDGAGTQTTEIVEEGADACNKGVLHTSGSGFSSYVGLGSVVTGTYDTAEEEYVPDPYDATTLGYTGISFRAKAGANQQYPVRFSVTTPQTMGDDTGDGSCTDMADVDNGCWNHMGHFLIDDEELTTQWQTYTFCFDRDLYPMWVPTHLTVDQRNNVGKNMLNLQFQFNQGFDQATTEQHPLSGSFDFYVDDIRLVKDECPTDIFESTGGASDAFGTNDSVGSCAPVAGGEKFNTAISQAYRRWRSTFVVSDGGALKVISPEQDNRTVSEAMGYGMLIAAAMGDKETFDGLWSWTNSRLDGNGVLGWDNGSGGSATDADTDIAYALLMAEKQWPGSGYAAAGDTMASKAGAVDISGSLIKGGSQYDGVYNPSYFSPGFYRTMGAPWSGIIAANYSQLNSCDQNFTGADGIVPDWCDPSSGQPAGNTGAQVTSEVCNQGEACSAYDASRIPWRIGYDVCMGGSEGTSFLNTLVSTFNSKYPRIDTLETGFDATGNATSGSVQNEMAFIGTVGTGAQAAGNAAMAQRAMRSTLDIMERPEYYKTYYSTTLGLLTLLMMSGNWPVP